MNFNALTSRTHLLIGTLRAAVLYGNSVILDFARWHCEGKFNYRVPRAWFSVLCSDIITLNTLIGVTNISHLPLLCNALVRHSALSGEQLARWKWPVEFRPEKLITCPGIWPESQG